MGFAKDKMDAATRSAVAARQFAVKTDDAPELGGLCPFHEESNSSFSYNIEKDVYFCQSCQATGDLVDLWCFVNGHTDKKAGFIAFCKAHQIGKNSGTTKKTGPTGNSQNKQTKIVPIIDESVWKQMKPLPEAFIKQLKNERGWTREAINKLDLRLQTVYFDKNDKTIRQVTRANRVAIPIRNEHGQLVNIRPYRPGAKTAKIISWAKGHGAAQLYPAKPNGDNSLVILCEGEPDTICALSHGLNAITQTSKLVNWPEQQKKQFLNLDVIIAYDADQAGQDYALKAAKALSGVAKSIKILQWPEIMGCEYGYWPLNHGEDLTDFFQKHKFSVMDFKSIKSIEYNNEIPKKQTEQQTTTLPRPLGGEEFFHINNQGRWSFKSRLLADRICNDLSLLYDPLTSIMYKYNGTFWESFQEEYLETIALRHLGDESTSSRAADAAKQAKHLSILPHGREINDSGMMCLKNGMLDMDNIEKGEVKLLPHHEEYYATYQLPIAYTDTVERKCIRWLQYLSETIITPKVIMQAQEFAGYCLTRETRYAKALILLGPGSDGKSTFISVIEQLVGNSNCAAVGLRDLEDQFYRVGIYNKMLCTSTEISKDYFDSVYFKAIVTGDTISAAHKNKDPFDFKPFCKMIFAGNELPRSRDNSDGYFRRILPIRFKKQFFGKEDDKHLAEALRDELPMILNWALAGLIRLIKQDGFTQCDETDQMLQQYRLDNNPVMAFVDAKCILGQQFEVNKDGIFRKYRDFCEQYNYRSLNNVHFFRELTTSQKNLRRYRPRINGKPIWMMQGIGLRADG